MTNLEARKLVDAAILALVATQQPIRQLTDDDGSFYGPRRTHVPCGALREAYERRPLGTARVAV